MFGSTRHARGIMILPMIHTLYIIRYVFRLIRHVYYAVLFYTVLCYTCIYGFAFAGWVKLGLRSELVNVLAPRCSSAMCQLHTYKVCFYTYKVYMSIVYYSIV